MTVTSAQVITLLENVLFESKTVATANAAQVTSVANFSASTSTVAGLAASLSTQAEASIAEQVVRYYQGALGRVPAPAEIAYYVGIAEAGLTPTQISGGTTSVAASTWAQIADYFAASPEFKADYGLTGTSVNQALVIQGFYQNILGRAPSSAEITFYENALASGYTYANLVQFFTTSPEYQAKADASIESDLAAAGVTAIATAAAGGDPLTSTTPIGTLPTETGSSFSYTTNGSSAVGATTFIAGLTVAGSSGSDLNSLTLNDLGGSATDTVTLPAGATLSNIELLTVNGSSTDAVVLDTTTSGWSSVTTVTVNGGAAETITASSSQSVIANDSGTGAITIQGGDTVTVTAAGGAVTIGTVTAPTGAVTVTDSGITTNAIDVVGSTTVTITATGDTSATAATAAITVGNATTSPTGAVVVTDTTGTANASTNGLITVTGGSTVTITENAGDAAAAGTNVAMGNVVVTGTTATTSVTVDQATVATGAAATKAATGVVGVVAVTAAPGTQGVTLVTAVAPSVASAGTVGVSADGTVNIADSVATSSTAVTGAAVAGGTIATVTLDNFTSANISSPALTTLSLSGVGGAVGLYEGGALHTTNTTLTLDVNGYTGGVITDNSAQFTKLNIVTGATASTLAGFTDASVTALNVSGSSVVAVTAATSATTITVTGAAGYAGAITDTTTTFNGAGSSGSDTITIAADATKAISGGTGTANEVILAAAGGTFTLAKTGAEVTGFQTLGVTTGFSGSQDASVFGTGINKIDVAATGLTATLTSVAQNAAINFSAAATTTTALVVDYTGASGATDATTITLQGAAASTLATGAAQTVTSLTVQDSNGNGVATLSFVDNNPAFNYAGDNIATLVDTAVSTLNFSGAGGLTIGGTAFTDDATSLAINNTGTNVAGLVVDMTDDSLGSLTFSGSGTTTVTLSDTVAGTLDITNSGTGVVTVTDTNLVAAHVTLSGSLVATLTDANLTSLTLAANETVTFVDAGTAGITVSGADDNNHVTLTLGAAISTATNTVTLGNANNSITDATVAGTVDLTVGTGSNLITLGTATTDTTGIYNVTLGTHTSTTGIDAMSIGTAGSNVALDAPNLIVTGAVKGDTITLAGDVTVSTDLVGTGLTSGAGTITATSLTSASSAALAVTDLISAVGATAEHIAVGVYGGNTYIVESNATAAASGTNTTIIELMGVHTISTVAGTAGGVHLLTIAS